ncbi:MAG: hypothetical protein D6797_06930 [Bdellovibrio sp.]|nr:MAG: hypothetical protein D6797_06930 [Bdellovibrio sp.]
MGMGFHLISHKKGERPLKNLPLFLFLHFLIGGLLLGFFFSPGCTASIEEKDAPLGKQATVYEVVSAIKEALGDNNILKAKTGAAVLYESNIRVNTSGVKLRQTLLQKLIAKKSDKNGNIRLVLEEIFTDYLVKEPSPVKRERVIDIKAPHSSSIFSIASLNNKILNNVIPLFLPKALQLQDNPPEKEPRQTFHDLKVQHLQLRPPRRVRESPHCANIPNCQLDVTQVSYTIAFWKENQLTFRVKKTSLYSPQIPYIATPSKDFPLLSLPVLSDCYKYVYHEEDKKYLVSECIVLRDFQYQDL